MEMMTSAIIWTILWVLFAALVIAVILVLIFGRRRRKTDREAKAAPKQPEKAPPKEPELMGDLAPKGRNARTNETENEIYAKQAGKWVCPACETIVDGSSPVCPICGTGRQKE